MVFACQRDSFQRTFTSNVVSCEPGKIKVTKNGKQTTEDCYEVVCEDTILFPEGGGQPYDTGYLNDVRVEQVLRRGGEAVHYVRAPIAVGTEVKQVVDWERRWDHIQHHSGQHLITAIASALYGYETTSWWLGDKICHIELDTSKLTNQEMVELEREVNNKILEQIPVNVTIIDKNSEGGDVRARGLPKDHVGDVRLVEIVGIESNMCCGTHITNTIQLQSIKLLYFEKGKKNKTNLMFIVGSRVLKYLGECLAREVSLTALLKNGPDIHVELVEKLLTNQKNINKKLSNVLKELALFEKEKYQLLEIKPKFVVNYYKDGDVEFLNVLVKELNNAYEETLFVFAVGDEKGAGNVVVYGKPDVVKDVSLRINDELNGKGAQHGSKYQAKVCNLGKLKNVEKYLLEYFH